MPKPFYENGIRFECQGSGRCCLTRGQYGFVYLTLADRRRLARYFGMATSAFTRKYCRRTGGWWHLRNPERDCEFLRDGKCGAYEARPAQCRTWPFWPENMNPRAWNRDVVGFCAGVGKGRLYSADEIRTLMKQDPLSEDH